MRPSTVRHLCKHRLHPWIGIGFIIVLVLALVVLAAVVIKPLRPPSSNGYSFSLHETDWRLFDAIWAESDIGTIAALIEANPTLVRELQADGLTALHLAAELERVDVVGDLLAAGADPNAPTLNGSGQGGYTPLHAAVIGGDLDIVRSLILAGAQPDIEDELGRTAGDYADEQGKIELLEFLKKNATQDDG